MVVMGFKLGEAAGQGRPLSLLPLLLAAGFFFLYINEKCARVCTIPDAGVSLLLFWQRRPSHSCFFDTGREDFLFCSPALPRLVKARLAAVGHQTWYYYYAVHGPAMRRSPSRQGLFLRTGADVRIKLHLYRYSTEIIRVVASPR